MDYTKIISYTYKHLSYIFFYLVLFIGLVWFIFNIGHEPLYGDTREYWELSKNLKVDSWRTLGYPLILRVASYIPEDIIIQRTIVYLFQTVVCLFAFYYLFVTVISSKQQKITKNTKKNALLLSVFITASPLIMHFNLSILSDSLANSLFIITTTSLLRLYIANSNSALNYTLLLAGTMLTGLFRQDRLLILILIFMIAIIYSVIKTKNNRLIIVFALIVALATMGINTKTQLADGDRPKISIRFIIFDRIVQGRLSNNIDHIPESIRERTVQNAENWDKSQIYWVDTAKSLDNLDDKKDLIRASISVLRLHAFDVTYDITRDFFEYIFTSGIYLIESLPREYNPSIYWTKWTNTRMASNHPRLTKIYFILYYVTLLIVLVQISYRHKTTRHTFIKNLNVFVWAATVIVVTSLVHTFQSSLEFHIRYALPIYSLQVSLIVWLYYSTIKDDVKSLSRS